MNEVFPVASSPMTSTLKRYSFSGFTVPFCFAEEKN